MNEQQWLTTINITKLIRYAHALPGHHRRLFTRLFILADVLEEAGCTDVQILTHLRSGGEHYRGCWAIDLLLGKE